MLKYKVCSFQNYKGNMTFVCNKLKIVLFYFCNLKKETKEPFWPGAAIAKCAFQLSFAVFTFLDNKILWFMDCQNIES